MPSQPVELLLHPCHSCNLVGGRPLPDGVGRRPRTAATIEGRIIAATDRPPSVRPPVQMKISSHLDPAADSEIVETLYGECLASCIN
jgi:hypothetical protein